MKQGDASKTISDFKTEPKSRAVSVAKVSELGVHQVRTKSIELYKGRGFEAPMAGSSTHRSGSQGKHK